jgi:choline dehydrogenase
LINKTGVLTGAGFDFIGWTNLPDAYRPALGAQALAVLAQFPPDWPEIEYVVAECPGPIAGGDYALIYTVLVVPLSRGNVTIQSNDTADHPIINPNWLASETDQKLNIEAFKTARAFFNTTAVRSIITRPEVSPGAPYRLTRRFWRLFKTKLQRYIMRVVPISLPVCRLKSTNNEQCSRMRS